MAGLGLISAGLLFAPAAAEAADLPSSAPAEALAEQSPFAGQEVVGERTEFSRTMRRADGSMRTIIGSAPLNFQDTAGDWQKIDTTFTADTGGLTNTAAGVDLDLPDSMKDGPTKITDEGRWVSFALQGAQDSAPDVSGASATYDDAIGGTDVVYESLPEGLKETLVLPDASAASTYNFTLKTSAGLTSRLTTDGSLEFRDGGGSVRFVLPAPTVQEEGDVDPRAAHVAYKLSADKQTLSVVVDSQWLQGAAFPVRVDPTIYTGTVTGCTIVSGTPTTSSCNQSIISAGGGALGGKRALLRFTDLSGVPVNAKITNARLRLSFRSQDVSGADTDVNIHTLGNTMQTGATWNTYDGVHNWTASGGAISTLPVQTGRVTAGYVGQWFSWELSTLVDGWVHDPGNVPNTGIAVRAVNQTGSNYLNFAGPAFVPPTGEDSGPPVLEVEWQRHSGFERDATNDSVGIDDRAAVTVNPASGNVAVNSTDLTLPGVAGLGVSIGRTFNSQDLGDSREFGWAWSLSVNGAGTDLRRTAPNNQQILRANGGAYYRFERDIPNDTATDYAFKTPPGIDADMSISKVAGATFDYTTVVFRKTGMKWTYDSPASYSGSGADPSGRLVKITDRNGNHIDLAYVSGNLSSIVETHGRTITVARTADGSISSFAIGTRTWNYGYITVQDLSSNNYEVLGTYTDPDSHITSYGYSGAANAGGAWDQVNQLNDANGNKIKWTYDGTGGITQMTRVVDNTSNDVTSDWSFAPVTTLGAYCTDTGLSSGAPTPNVYGRTVQTDPLGHKTTYCFNRSAQVIQTLDDQKLSHSRTYTPSANVQDFTELSGTASGQSVFSFSDSNKGTNLLGGQGPMGETFAIDYCTTSCAAGDKLDQYRPRTYTDEQNTQTLYGYDTAGNLTDVKDAQSPIRNKQTLTYNTTGAAKGAVATAVDGNAKTTTFSYDATTGDLTKVTPPGPASPNNLLGPTELTYDSVSRTKSVKDGRGTTATVTYDGEDRVTRVDYSSGSWFTFAFDNNGNLTQRVDSDGNTTSYSYDKLNRRLTEGFPSSRSNTYTYDEAGNLATLVDGAGTTSYTYDTINRLASITAPKPGGTDTINYTYTDAATRVQTATFPGGLQQISESDASGKVTKISVKTSTGSLLKSLAYGYRAASATKDAGLLDTLLDDANNKTTYSYMDSAAKEDVGRLVKAETKASAGTGSLVERYEYAFDPAGNRTQRTVTNSFGTPTVTSYAYNDVNELCWFYTGTSSNACTNPPAGAVSYTHDKQGNRTSGNSVSYTYDARNRLTAKAGTTFTYLSPGNSELVSSTTSSITTAFQNNILGLGREIGGPGDIAYTRQPNGAPIAARTSSSKRFLLSDRLGSVRWLADSTGGSSAITRTLTYDPDGNTLTNTGTGQDTNLKFAGGHVVQGHLHYGARYYDPSNARWTQQDPLNQIGSLTEANRYSYAAGDPANVTDPSGLAGLAGSCVTTSDNFSRSLCEAAGGHVIEGGGGDSDTKTRAQKACLLAGLSLTALSPEAKLIQIGVKILGLSVSVGCYTG